MFVDVTTGSTRSSSLGDARRGQDDDIDQPRLAIADAGSRVILVDGDLRNPSVAKAMGIEAVSG
ncbi:MAG: hypothetical protein IPH03_08900 [Tetrasphaera sp.]|nr:hypothetical protein [Tetrasphaera sp.]